MTIIKKSVKRFIKILCPKNKGTFGLILRTIGFFIFFSGDSDRSKKELNDILDNHCLSKCLAYFLILLFLGLFFSVFYFSFLKHSIFDSPTIFSVTAVTEQVNVITKNTPMSRWYIKDINISKTCPDEPEDLNLSLFTGSININPFVQITLSRIATGDLTVEMYTDKSKSVGDLFDEEDDFIDSLSNCAFFQIKNISDRANLGETIVLPLTGNIVPGKAIRFLSQNKTPILKKGKITILSRAFLTGENYSVGPFELDTGDIFNIQKDTVPVVPSQGFALINDEPAIYLVYRAKGYRGVIQRFHAEDYEIRNSFWSKLYHDEGLAITWGGIIILFGFIRIYLRFLVN